MTVYTRADWGAVPTVSTSEPLPLPIGTVLIHHTVAPCYTGADALDYVRQIDADHTARGWRGIGYSYVVDQAGDVYLGRELTTGAHAEGYNRRSVGIAWIGDGRTTALSAAAVDSIASIVRGLRSLGALDPDWTLEGHRDVNATECPGALVYQALPAIRDVIDRGGPVSSTEETVRALYRTYCLREGDPGGVAYWTGLLDSGGIDTNTLALRMIVDEGWTALTRRTEK